MLSRLIQVTPRGFTLTSVGEKESPTDEVITSIMYSLKSHYIFRNSVQVGISEFLY